MIKMLLLFIVQNIKYIIFSIYNVNINIKESKMSSEIVKIDNINLAILIGREVD